MGFIHYYVFSDVLLFFMEVTCLTLTTDYLKCVFEDIVDSRLEINTEILLRIKLSILIQSLRNMLLGHGLQV